MLADKKLLWLIFTGVMVGVFEFFSLGGIRLPAQAALPFFTAIILAVGHHTVWNGLKALIHLNFREINLLMLLAAIGAYYLGEFEEAAVVIVLFNLAERLEHVGIAKAKSSLDELINKMPQTALLKGGDQPVPVDRVKTGDVVIVKPFQCIPLDGEVVEGASFVDDSMITGEPIPKDKRIGDKVFAGTLNKQGNLEVKVLKESSQSAFAKIRAVTFEAMKHKAETQKFIEKFSKYYTPGIIVLALFWAFIPWWMGSVPFQNSLSGALMLLVISCPCALVISTPISIYSALGNASSKGALIKGGRSLEAIGQIGVCAFDKTRTLTFGNPVVTDVISFGDKSREELLACAAGTELLSEHPLAQSIVTAAKKEDLELHKAVSFESVVGKGAKAECLVCDDKHHCIGKLEFILEEHHVPDKVMDKIAELQNEGKTVIVISTHKQVEGVIAIEDEVRPESREVVQELAKMKIESCMLTGDHEVTAKAVAKQVGIKEVKADLLPQDKAQVISTLSKKHKVAMVGDGVNDAPALALSSVGISMSKLGSDAALEAASIVLLSDHLKIIPYLVRLGKRTLRMIQFNTTFAISVKFLFIALAMAGYANLALAIFADVGVTLIVILNSLRLMR